MRRLVSVCRRKSSLMKSINRSVGANSMAVREGGWSWSAPGSEGGCNHSRSYRRSVIYLNIIASDRDGSIGNCLGPEIYQSASYNPVAGGRILYLDALSPAAMALQERLIRVAR